MVAFNSGWDFFDLFAPCLFSCICRQINTSFMYDEKAEAQLAEARDTLVF